MTSRSKMYVVPDRRRSFHTGASSTTVRGMTVCSHHTVSPAGSRCGQCSTRRVETRGGRTQSSGVVRNIRRSGRSETPYAELTSRHALRNTSAASSADSVSGRLDDLPTVRQNNKKRQPCHSLAAIGGAPTVSSALRSRKRVGRTPHSGSSDAGTTGRSGQAHR